MKKSEFKKAIKEEIIEILSEAETADDINDKAKAQAELNKELEKTKELTTEEGKDYYADYEDIAQDYLLAHNSFKNQSNEYLEKLGKKIVDDLYDGDIGKAYDEIVLSDFEKTIQKEEEEPKAGDLKGDSVSKLGTKLQQTTAEMKRVVKKWKDAEGAEKVKLTDRLRELTKIKKEIESLLQ
tara:strand:- start:1211 stop:1756 length:546 start_codon:yes stop_codon:yes gene_type:complete